MTRMLCRLFIILLLAVGVSSCSLFGSDSENVSASEIDNESVANVEDLEESGDELDDEFKEEGVDEIAALDDGDGIEDDDNLDNEFADLESDEQSQEPVQDEFSSTDAENVDKDLVGDELSDFEEGAQDEFAFEEVKDENPVVDVPQEEPTTPIVDIPSQEIGGPQVVNLEYKAFENGGTVVIETSGPARYKTISDPTLNQLTIEVLNVALPEQYKRPYITKDFKQDIATINAYESGNDARFVIQLKRPLRPLVQQEGNSILVVTNEAGIISSLGQKPNSDGESLQAKVVSEKNIEDAIVAAGPQGVNKFGNDKKTGLDLNSGKFIGEPISLEFTDTDVRAIIDLIAEKSGANLIMDRDVEGVANIRLRDVPWDQALLMVLRSQGLGYVKQGNVLRIAKQKTLSDEATAVSKQIESEKKAQLLTGGLKVKYIPVSYAKVSELSPKVKEFLSEKGKVAFDDRTSSLVVTDYAEYLERVTQLVSALDTPPMQVEIESKLVEAREDFSREAGINWDIQGAQFGSGSQTGNFNSSFGASSGTAGNFSFDLSVGTFDIFGDLTAALDLFERQNKIKVLSQPKVVTLNKTKAEIKQVTQVPIQAIQQQIGQPSIATFSFRDLELSLGVTPQITFKGDVILDVEVKREFAGVRAPNGERELNKRSTKTTVMVKNGKTAVIGGIYQLDDSDSDEGIPILKDIPLIGYLFKRVEVTKNKNELLLFLKPKIVKEISGPMVSKSGPPEASYDPFEEISVDEGRESFENKAEVETDEILESGLEDLPGDDNFSKPTDSEFDEEFAEGDGEEEELTL